MRLIVVILREVTDVVLFEYGAVPDILFSSRSRILG